MSTKRVVTAQANAAEFSGVTAAVVRGSGYVSWGAVAGTSGYGVRYDATNGVEFKHSGGSWVKLLPQGPQGSQGDNGNQGNKGFQGNDGFPGRNGDIGVDGDRGAQGPQGYQGNQGAQGPQGYDGYGGNPGDPGGRGTQGGKGPQGYTGYTGNAGYGGNTGARGNQGGTGSQGAQGPQGPRGVQGSTGPQGYVGYAVATYPVLSPNGHTGYGVYGWAAITGGSYIQVATPNYGANGITYWLSDRSKKQDIGTPEDDAVAAVMAIPFCRFAWKRDNKTQEIGFTSQDLRAVREEFVNELSEGTLIPAKFRLFEYAIKALQDTLVEVDALEAAVAELEAARG